MVAIRVPFPHRSPATRPAPARPGRSGQHALPRSPPDAAALPRPAAQRPVGSYRLDEGHVRCGSNARLYGFSVAGISSALRGVPDICLQGCVNSPPHYRSGRQHQMTGGQVSLHGRSGRCSYHCRFSGEGGVEGSSRWRRLRDEPRAIAIIASTARTAAAINAIQIPSMSFSLIDAPKRRPLGQQPNRFIVPERARF